MHTQQEGVYEEGSPHAALVLPATFVPRDVFVAQIFVIPVPPRTRRAKGADLPMSASPFYREERHAEPTTDAE